MEWINSLLNGESGSAVQLILITLGLVIALILIFWLFRRIVGTPARRAARNRVPRLSITDVTAVDDKRFLVLARRDNVEHLVLIGGPTDVVVETGIIRAKQPQQVQKERTPQPATKAETEAEPKIAPDKTDVAAPAVVAASAATSVTAVTEAATEATSTIAESATDTVTEAQDMVADTAAEMVETATNVINPEPLIEAEANVDIADVPEFDISLDEVDLEATLSDALSSQELSADLVEEPAPTAPIPEPEPVITEDVGTGMSSSPDDEMQKLLAELANETKEPAQ